MTLTDYRYGRRGSVYGRKRIDPLQRDRVIQCTVAQMLMVRNNVYKETNVGTEEIVLTMGRPKKMTWDFIYSRKRADPAALHGSL